MYSDKKNILQLTALLIEHGIRNVVLCPGSRNAPIVHTLANHSFFQCYSVTDERSAGFFALGLALQSGKPAAVCCTSGTALLNIHPAVAEAFYQQVPLVVISADRPAAWIGQMDGQTLPQPGVFNSLVKKSVNLPEIHTDEDEWYCNRLINEALLELNHHGKGPVHINVPISEPLFRFSTGELPKVRVITRYQGLNVYDKEYNDLIDRMNKYNKRMMVVGQMNLIYLFEKKICKLLYKHFTWLTEHTGNRTVPGMPIKNFDALIYSMPEDQQEKLIPELVITYGGHVVSKRLKQFLRKHPPKEHWHVSLDGEVADLYGSITTVIEMDPFEFLEKIAYMLESNKVYDYPKVWENLSKNIPEPEVPYSEISAIGSLIKALPAEAALHLANSSTVRYAQLFSVPESVEVCCNRGTSGIEGSMSTAIGYAAGSEKLNFIIIGDLSFFYDMNALWNNYIRSNVRILLLNNGGGEIFQALPGFEMTEQTRRFVTATHSTTAQGWATERGFQYTSVHNKEELEEAMTLFTQTESTEKPLLMEVFTDKAEDIKILKDYYHKLK
ncbi:2-succinyl-5-enolpyruvyl-6-hydroxy-3-cyclohexene-1-carboxylic-acid synthase [Parabacteroides bouchesdurhonensis]|uniref:2-succinyl-5-enolpyruvyl-6-hydroxy-3- cyclohexene-1-carboxylic-acid synthase n=1 Tax=Parabacteroides bouchesdurhonensis TaxID=1936995 RepID=UPI000E54D17F|nr:2-succinyl-5-enolpyruvyl-6-hydroxy-3-cyclohexene-1-carboxylic-acid synthase [Parabacteroides bouchesdurhonensis]RHJ91319.1 2-succinyl-5-enolpyruvyl-6-hydroxy-3-cyclohexene-1-carboxylic-acid synthase [Bacteroides sp. AM07-16]